MKTLRYLLLSFVTAGLPSCGDPVPVPAAHPVIDYDVITPPDRQHIEAAVPEAKVYRAIAVGRARAIQPTVVQKVSLDYNVSKRAIVTDAVLEAKMSGVLKGFGQYIIEQCRKQGICPVFATAVMMHESANGTSKFAKDKNNVAGIYDGKNKKYVEFDDVQQCIAFTIELLSNDSYAGKKRQTLSAIQKRYCPVGAANDPKGINDQWAGGVQHWMKVLVGSGSVYCVE